jgi:hypothetical protein
MRPRTDISPTSRVTWGSPPWFTRRRSINQDNELPGIKTCRRKYPFHCVRAGPSPTYSITRKKMPLRSFCSDKRNTEWFSKASCRKLKPGRGYFTFFGAKVWQPVNRRIILAKSEYSERS